VNAAVDRLAELAARLLGAPTAQVSLLSDVQTVAGGSGLPPGAVGSTSPLAESLCAVTAAQSAPLVVVDATIDDRVSELAPVTSGQVGAYLGVPLTTGEGHTVGALCVFGPDSRAWSDHDVSLLNQLAASVIAEMELAALAAEFGAGQLIWDLAMDSAGIGTWDYNLETGALSWDERLLDLFGYDTLSFDGTIEAFQSRLHPDDRARVQNAMQSAIETCGDYSAEYRIVLPGGDTRWVAARGRAIAGSSGKAIRLLGAAYDATAQRDGDARVARVLESMPAAFYAVDRDWCFSYVNGEAERLLGQPRDALLGRSIWELFPEARGSDFERYFRQAVESQEPVSFEAHYPEPLDGWYELRAWPTVDGLSVYFIEVTSRHVARQEAERAAMRSELIANVTAELTETLDPEEGVARLAQLVVPTLADWCLVTLVTEDDHPDWRRRLRDIGWWHADPERRPMVEEYAQLRIPALQDTSLVADALRSKSPAMQSTGATERLGDMLVGGRPLELLRELAPTSVAVLPMLARGRTIGLMTLFHGEGRPSLTDEDLQTLREVASRAGLALDNARLYAHHREVAEALQTSLLTAPPQPDHVEIAVRYVPAAEAAQVGGDWYDAFLQSDGSTVLVIGDVVGHDTAAAAAMGQVRGLLRGIASYSGEGPAAILRGVDSVMRTLQVDTTATAVVARLEQTAEELDAGVTRLVWSNAGHPPPMLMTADGPVTMLTAETADLLLGIRPDTRRLQTERELDCGATLLLYTDGLVERRDQPIDEGLALLQETLTTLAAESLPLEQLCDQIVARMLPVSADDDVALVAVRLHPHDRPRPAEAGPEDVPPDVAPAPA
jgi:PAS domain S-box-containing protein